MTSVHEELDLPGGEPGATLHIVFTLVGSLGVPVVGFVPPDITIVSTLETDPDVNGEYTVDLESNDNIIPSGTRWKREVIQGRALLSTEYLDVPTSGPVEVQDILDTAPASIADSALAAHMADRSFGSHIPDGPANVGDVVTVGADGVTPEWAAPTGGGGGGGFTQEQIEDFVGLMVSGNTETGISVTYDDPSSKLNFVAEVTQAELDAEAALARNADNLTSGTVADARIAATITRDSELTAAIAALAAVYQPLDNDLTLISAAGNGAILAATTASFLTAHETKLGHITVTQAVDLDAIETRVNQLDAAVVLAGTWDASAGTFPGGGTAQAGASYIVSVAGTVDGVAFAINDRAIAITDNASTTTFANNWFKADYTDQVLSVDGMTGAVSLASTYQPLDSDLTSIAALATTAYGRDFLTRSNAAAGIAYLGLDADLATFVVPASTTISSFWAGILDETSLANTLTALGLDTSLATLALPDSTTISSFIKDLLDDATAATARATLGVPDAAEGARMDITGTTTLTFAVDLTEGVSGGDTLVGGTGASETLAFNSTSHATRGTIDFRDFITLVTEDKNSTAGTEMRLVDVSSSRTFTFDESAFNAGNSVTGFAFRPTLVYSGATLAAGDLFDVRPVVKNNNGVAQTIAGFIGLHFRPTLRGDGATATIVSTAVNDATTVDRINSGSTAVTHSSLSSAMVVDTGATVATRTGFAFNDATGAGTLTTQVGVEIAALAKGGTNIGLRNASTTVKTPIANSQITATSATIRHDASIVTLTANNSYTLASAPTISNGISGEELLIINVDTADTITLQDQGTLASSNLRLAASTVALGPRDSIRLVYDGTIGDWVQVGQTNVL